MHCPICNSENYHLFERMTYKNGLVAWEVSSQEVYKACLDCNMRTGYYQSANELQQLENRNPFKRADW